MPIPADTLPFLTELKANNNREWFNEHKPRYTALQAELIDFIDQLIGTLISHAPEFVGIDPKKCLFRIHKDARFAKGEPYKTHIGIHMVGSGHRADFGRAGFYLHIEPSASFLAGGAHAPSSDWLKRIREQLLISGNEFEGILTDKTFKKYFTELEGATLTRPPAGFAADSPHLDLIKRKAFTVSHPLTDDELTSAKFLTKFGKVFSVYQPFMNYLNHA